MICQDCKFWEATRIRNRGACRRYPTPIDTAPSHWCGEYAEKTVVGEIVPAEEPKKKGKRDVGNVQ